METIGKVTFYGKPLRRPAIVEVGCGYRHDGILRAFKAPIDDLILFERPGDWACADILGHLEEAE